MDRRNFLIKGALAMLGLAVLPIASRTSGLPVAYGAQMGSEARKLSESEVLQCIVDYTDSWKEVFPETDFRELALKRLVTEKTGMSYEEFEKIHMNHLNEENRPTL